MNQRADGPTLSAPPDPAAAVEKVATMYDRVAAWEDPAVFVAVADRNVVLDSLRRADPAAPLYGLVYAVKDNIDVAGLGTTAGCPPYRSVPDESAPVVRRLEAAGAVCLGKTNMDQFATGLVGTRSPYGTPINPLDATLAPGGSSSGSAVAVAAGLVDFALGTDTAGSGRVPAAHCRIVGLKPTRGRLSTRGVVPAVRSIDCVSVLAADVALAWRVFSAADGFDPLDPYSRRRPAQFAGRPPGVLRVGVADVADLDSDADQRAWDASCARLADLDVERVEVDIAPFLEAGRLLYEGAWVAERDVAVGAFLDEAVARGAEGIDPSVATIIGASRSLTAADAYRSAYRLSELRRDAEATWQRVDVLMMPTTPGVATLAEVRADPLGRNSRLGIYTTFANLLDLSALAVPGPDRSDGRPFGVQFIAPAFHDETVARLAAAFLDEASPLPEPSTEDWFTLVVVGAHLSGQPLNHQLTERDGRLVTATRTAPIYRLFALAGTESPKPGLVRVADGETAAAIEVELWALPPETVGSFVSLVRAPLCIGRVVLADGSTHPGFLCEQAGLAGATDISELGGWRAYRGARP